MATKPVFKDTDQGPVIRRKLNEMGELFVEGMDDIEDVAADVILAKQYRDEAEGFKNITVTKAGEAKGHATDAKASELASKGHATDARASELGAANSRNSALSSEQNAKVFRNEAEQFANQSEDASANAALAAAEAIAAVGEKMPLLMQPQVISTDITIPTGYNALIIGEFHVNPGVIIEGQGSATLRGL